MPGPIVDFSSMVTCTHAGMATPMVPSTRAFIEAQPVITLASTYAVAGCLLAATASAPFCVVGAVTVGAARVFVEGLPVVVQSATSACVATGLPLIFVSTQLRVIAT